MRRPAPEKENTSTLHILKFISKYIIMYLFKTICNAENIKLRFTTA